MVLRPAIPPFLTVGLRKRKNLKRKKNVQIRIFISNMNRIDSCRCFSISQKSNEF